MTIQIWISRRDKVFENIYRWLPEKEATVYEHHKKHDDDSLQLFRWGQYRKSFPLNFKFRLRTVATTLRSEIEIHD